MKNIIIAILLYASLDKIDAQCQISQGNFFLDYYVATCNGLTFQSAIGALVPAYGDCNNLNYTSPLTQNSTTTNTHVIQLINAVTIYPNPSYGSLSIKIKDLQSVLNFAILNTVGQSVYTDQFIKGEQIKQLDLLHLDSGYYIIQFYNDNQIIKSVPFIKSSI